MKFLIKLCIVQIASVSLLITDTMAREVNKKEASAREVKRPNVRPSDKGADKGADKGGRSPFTGSKIQKPSAKPSDKPAQRPVSKPAPKPEKRPGPNGKPENRPDPNGKPENRPGPNGKPENRPGPNGKPENRPGPNGKPENRPGPNGKPENRPGPNEKPENRPGPPKPGNRPETKPGRPEARPETKPGNVVYPKPMPTPKPKPSGDGNKRPSKPVVRPGQNTKPVQRPNLDRPNSGNSQNSNQGDWWNAGKRPGNNQINSGNTTINQINNNQINNNQINNNQINNNQINKTRINNNQTQNVTRNVKINNNFQNNVNWSTDRKNWGSNPWWNRPATRPWYGGSWNGGWNQSYYKKNQHYHYHHSDHYYGYPGYTVYQESSSVSSAIGWGLVGWGLGSLIFNSGYNTYTNPYPAQPVPSAKGGQVTYNQPITVVASQSTPDDQEEIAISTEKSESFIAESQVAFKQRNYLVALDYANKAVAESPGDGALHEFRALVLFSLGKFSEAAGVLNPVLASGPGWDWSTMVTLYDSQETYSGQLKALEEYSIARPGAADARFLLGYHYMICGHMEDAAIQFESASKLQPADSVSRQLADLVKATGDPASTPAEAVEQQADEEELPEVEPIPLEKLTGVWVSDRGQDGKITLSFQEDGKFNWSFKKDDKSNEFAGDYSINDSGLLVLDAEESQMVATVELAEERAMKFVLSGGPPNDPGLAFAKAN